MIGPRSHGDLTKRGTFVLLALALGALACDSEFVGNLNPSTVPCQVSASMPVQSLAATGGSGSLQVSALPECAWRITPSSTWISGVTPASGQGEQQVTFVVAANPTQQARQAEIVINAFKFTVMQEAAPAPPPPPPPAPPPPAPPPPGPPPTDTAPPTVTLSVPATTLPVNQAVALTATAADNVGVTRVEFYANGVLISSDTTAPYTATWTPTQTIAFGLRAEGVDAAGNRGVSSQVNVTVTATAPPPPPADTVPPTVTLSVPGATLPVSQAVALTATATDNVGVTRVEFYANGVLISTDPTAPYTASWTPTQVAVFGLRAEGVDAAGNRGVSPQVNVTVTAAPPPPPSCTYILAAPSATIGASGGALTVGLTTGASCTWTVQSQASWITRTSAATGVGPVTVALTVAANSGNARTGTVSIATQTFTVNQAAPCTYQVSPERINNVSSNGATGLTATVTTTAGCAWTAVSSASWITVTAGTAGSGPGGVTFTVSPNTGSDRTGTLTIAGHTLRVDQND